MKTKLTLLFILFAFAAAAQPLLLNGTQVKKDGTTITTNALRQLMVNTNNIATRGYVDSTAGGSGWSLTGDAGTVAGTNFLGTTDAQRLWFKTNNKNWMWLDTLGRLNLHSGYDTTRYDTTNLWNANTLQLITDNQFTGVGAGDSARYNITDSLASRTNFADGKWALRNNKVGYNNYASGHGTLTYLGEDGDSWNTTTPTDPYKNSFEVTAISNMAGHSCRTCKESLFAGQNAGASCYSCQGCTFVGIACGAMNKANGNTGTGTFCLRDNISGSGLTANGASALGLNTTGSNSTATGSGAASNNTTGFTLAVYGKDALFFNTTGNVNGAFMARALVANTTGSFNMAFGYEAGGSSNLSNRWYFSNLDSYTSVANDSVCWLWGIDNADKTLRKFKVSAKFAVNDGNQGIGKRLYNPVGYGTQGYLEYTNPTINTTAGDGATIDNVSGRFRKDTSGTTFTLTNAYITANSIIIVTFASDPGATGYGSPVVVAGAGSAVITFMTAGSAGAPGNDTDVNFIIEN